MLNRDIEAAWRFHNGTKLSWHIVHNISHYLDLSNKPLPFKIYPHLPGEKLPGDLPSSGVPALAGSPAPAEEWVPTRRDLARLFYFAAGITKRGVFPGGQIYFRAAACTGALYHIEIYLVCGDLPDLPAGVYHFGVHDFALRRLREGDYRGVLLEATGHEPAVSGASAVIVTTSVYWRNSWKSQARAYRHAYWDSGTILANLLAVGAANRVPLKVITAFVDKPVNRLLDLDDQREVARALDQFGNEVGDVAFIWSVLGPAGSIDEAGVFTAGTKAGTYGGGLTVEVIQGTVTKRATARVVVEPGPLDHVQLEPAMAVVEVTNQQQFTATALDRFGNPVPGPTFAFRSAEQAGQVDSQGVFTAGTKAGTYGGGLTVEVTQGSVTRRTTADVTITPGLLSRVAITPRSVELTPGLQQHFLAAATDRYGNRITVPLAWSVETGAGTIDAGGRFTAGTKAGTYDNGVRVTAAQGGIVHSASGGITVTAITAVSAGRNHTCLVTTMGEVKCWGVTSLVNLEMVRPQTARRGGVRVGVIGCITKLG